MDPDDLSPRFQDAFSRIQATQTVAASLEMLQQTYEIDFVTYHMGLTITDVVDTPYVKTTYPDTWVSHYLVNGYAKIDPILREGFSRQMPFDWREVEIPGAAYDFLTDAMEHGLGSKGYSIPIVDKSRRALLSLNSRMPDDLWSAFVIDNRDDWLELGFLIHRKAVFELHGEHDPIPALGVREIECLHWAALGNDSSDIAVILGLSEHTTRSYLKSARFKLGCATTAAATALATQLRLISPYNDTLK